MIKKIKRAARNEYSEISEAEKNITRKYERNRYYNMSEEKKQKLKEYQKNHYEAKKSQFSDQ